MLYLPRFIVIDDHSLVREALVARLVLHWGDIDVIYSGASSGDALRAIELRGADCVLLDLELGDGRPSLLTVAEVLEAGVPVLIISAFATGAIVRAAFAAGVVGFVSKSAGSSELIDAVNAVLDGETYTSAEAAAALLGGGATLVDLSDQERRAMVLYASGLKMRSVARQMGVSESTAREYIRRLRAKYDRAGAPLRSKTELYRMAQREGLLP